MNDNPQQKVVLTCSMCGLDSEHEVHYAGRILAHARCMHCGTVMRQSTEVLRKAYIKDLEQRVASKPWRLVRRILSEPNYLFKGLPNAVKRQPKKFLNEAKELRDPDKHPDL